ncbi:MAG TPA: 1,4-dihydroxy-2-naphthoate polyprenyltransferase [Candidatus Latescibacteria bacterium]|nr:1,4-dihydroxy-2-naphthoate polyprenyltransferase [Candidatus Latescibacterota bacterium]
MMRLPTPGSPGAYLLAARPKTLPAAIAPVFVGSACAFYEGMFAWYPASLALVCAILIQVGANFANDLLDFEKGHDTTTRVGPVRAVQTGLLTREQMRAATVAVFGSACVLGLLLTLHSGWPVAAIGIASIVAALAYTAGPYPLGYHGLGDVFVMLFFGFVAVCGTAFVQMQTVPGSAWITAVAVGALSTAILVVNNVRDSENDRTTGKRTLAVILGLRLAKGEYLALLVTAYLVPVAVFVFFVPHAWVFLPLASTPLAILTARRFLSATTGAEYNSVLAQTGVLLLTYSVLLSTGLVLPALR